MIFRTSDGVSLSVTDTGPDPAPVTVLLLHGWTSDHSVWHQVIVGLAADEDVRVLAPDLRGHGASDPAPRGTATIDQLADDVAELVEQCVPTGTLVLAGHSMGGMTLMALAARHPALVTDRAAAALFVATSSGGLADITLGLPAPLVHAVQHWQRNRKRQPPTETRSDPTAPPATAGRQAPTLPGAPLGSSLTVGAGGTGPSAVPCGQPRDCGQVTPARTPAPARGALPIRNQALARRLVRWLVFGTHPDPEAVRSTTAQIANTDRRSAGGFRRSIGRHEQAAALATFAGIPTTVLVGDRDRLTPVSHAAAIAAALPGAELVLYPGAGHMLPYERSTELVTRLRAAVRSARRA